MVKLIQNNVQLINGKLETALFQSFADTIAGKAATITYSILSAHNTSGNMDDLRLRFDALASHDITYVGIIQTTCQRLRAFPSLCAHELPHRKCAVGGTINEDDHLFGLSAAKYGGEFVPAHLAVIHQYMQRHAARAR